MTVTIPIQAIEFAPGSQIVIHHLSWQNFEQLLIDLGTNRHTHITYYRGTLEIVAPLALHERQNRIIAYIITTILEVQGRNWEDFGSTTLKRKDIAGVEPDSCFYIQNVSQVKGCSLMDLGVYPPPDLAIESDVTSKTTLDAYIALGVPEVWIYSQHQLAIYLLENSNYAESVFSPTFPNLPIIELIPQLVQKAIQDGTSQMLRELRTYLRESQNSQLISHLIMQFADFWYIVALSEQLRPNMVLKRSLLGEWLAIFRSQDGQPVALRDRCLHRNSRLSTGKVCNGAIQCPYHGWIYDGNGKVIAVPSEGDSFKPSPQRQAKSYATKEQDGYVYVRLAETKNEDFQPFAMPHYGEVGWETVRVINRFANNVTNCVENFIDIPHTVFVHPGVFRTSHQQKLGMTVERLNGSVLVEYRQ